MQESMYSFIRDILATTLRTDTVCLLPDIDSLEKLDQGIMGLIYEKYDYGNLLKLPLFEQPEDDTVYFLHASLERKFVVLKLPEDAEHRLFVMGPILYEEPSAAFYERIFTESRIPGSAVRPLKTYLHTIPVVDEIMLINTAHIIASYIFTAYQSERVVNINISAQAFSGNEPVAMLNFAMDMLEKRYRIENKLMDAISQGDSPNALKLLYTLGSCKLPPRVYDPIRDLKNVLIIINTLSRKAAEKGRVHPVYLDELSTKFSLEIERTNNPDQLQALPVSMVRRYCLLVNNHSLASYSHTIGKAINHINLNLSSPLSLSSLADTLKLNHTYLSAQFKKETGATLTEYIHTARIQAAVQLLNSTDLPVREVAYHVGIEDFSYFTKLFKKIIHLSPAQYRRMLHSS